MKRFMHNLHRAAVALAALTALAGAQNVSGPPTDPWGAYQRSLSDAVDVAHIHVGFTVPVLSKAERGLPRAVSLAFGSIAWSQKQNAWTPSGVPDAMPPDGPVVGQFSSKLELYECNDDYGYNYFFNVATAFTYVDASGVTRFGGGPSVISVEDDFPPECDPAENPGYPAEQVVVGQGTGWVIAARSDGSATITTPAGVTISGWDPANPADNAVAFVDRNGNEMNESHSPLQVTSFDDEAGGPGLSIVGSPQAGGLSYDYSSAGSGVHIAYGSYTLATNFGCAGVSEYSQSVHLPTQVTLIDGSSYAVTYEPTPGYPAGYTTGRIASLQLPAGATIHYTYPASQPHDDINCGTGGTPNDGAGRTLEIDRQTPDGTTTYTASTTTVPAYYTTLQLTTVTAPSGDQTVETFAPDGNYFLVKKQVYTGSSAAGSLLFTEDRCNQMSIASCDYWFVPQPVTVEDRITLPDGKMKDTMSYWCDGWGCLDQPYEVDESSWYTSGSPVWARKEITGYTTAGPELTPLPVSTKVEDGNGTVVAETDYAYDQTQPTPSGVTMHQTGINFGNLTTVTYHTSGAATLTETIQYYDTGEPRVVTGVNGVATDYDYQCNGALPKHVSHAGGSGYDETWTFDCGLEKPTVMTGANGAQTSWEYGATAAYGLPTQVSRPGGSVTNITYTAGSPSAPPSTESVTAVGSSSIDAYTLFDSQGRTVLQQKADGSSWDTVATAYDADGRTWKVSAPFAASKGSSAGASAFTVMSYDGAGRRTEVEGPTNGWTKYTYTDNDVLTERGPAPLGESTKKRQFEYDALGRLSSVCEITSTLAGAGACGQTQAQTGYLTQYSYNLLGKITGVVQNAQATAGGQETRSFTFDELGRLTQETTPEAGTTSFWFDAPPQGSSCTASPGALVEREDASGNITCYAYNDSRHRLTEVSYPSGPNAGATPTRHFVYDATADGSTGLSNTLGRLAEAYTQTSAGVQVDEAFSYTAGGEVSDYYQSSPNSGGYYHSSETYFGNGAPDVLTLPDTLAITYGLDGAGRVATVSAAGQDPVTAASFSPMGLTSVTFGSGDSDVYGYNVAGEMTGYTFNVNGQADAGTLVWNDDGSLQQLSVSDAITGASDASVLCTYAEDDLGRLASADCGANQNQTFSYDAFGNMKSDAGAGAGYSFKPNFTLSNQIADLGATYDADGNLTTDPVNVGLTSQYDAEGKPVNFEGAAVVYDALGRAVEGGGKELVYGPGGAMIAAMSGQTAATATGYVPLPGGGTAVYTGTTLSSYWHADWQGSVRLASTPSRTLASSTQYAAFGQPFDSSASPDIDFTGQRQLYGASQYNFPRRNLSPVQARWWTPDPAGLDAVDPANPQTWNAYAYVNGDPLEETDPLGLCPSTPHNNAVCSGAPYTLTITAWGLPYAQKIDDPEADLRTIQDLGDLILASNQARPVLFGNSSIFAGVLRAGRKLASAVGNELKCAADTADSKYSIAAGLHALGVGNQGGVGGYLTEALGGNIFSGITNAALHGESVADAVVGGTYMGLPAGTGMGKGLGGVAVDAVTGGVWSAVTGAGEGIQTLNGLQSIASTAVMADEFATGVGEVRAAYDAAAFFVAGVNCL